MLKRIVIAGALALGLGACASPPRVPFDAADRQKLVEVRVLDVVPQDEIIVRAAPVGASAALGGGLLGAIIDSKVGESRQNDLQATLAPFYSSVDDFNLRAQFQRSLSTTLTQEKSVRFGEIQHAAQPILNADLQQRRKALGDDRGLMLSATSYTFSPDFTRLSMTTQVDLSQPGKDKPVFLNTYTYQSAQTGNGGAASLQAWAANNGERYRNAANEGIAQIMKMLSIDLASGPAAPAASPKVMLTSYGNVNVQVNGDVLVREPNRVIVRHTDGTMYSLPHAGGQAQ